MEPMAVSCFEALCQAMGWWTNGWLRLGAKLTVLFFAAHCRVMMTEQATAFPLQHFETFKISSQALLFACLQPWLPCHFCHGQWCKGLGNSFLLKQG